MTTDYSADLTGVRAVVTGATSGIGAAMAEALANAGAAVGFASRPSARLDSAVTTARAKGHTAVALPVDVRDPASVDRCAEEAFATLGGVDLVVNNAGIGMRKINPRYHLEPTPFFTVAPEDFDEIISTNVTGYFLVARAFSVGLVNQGHGRFVNISMSYSAMRHRGFIPYGPSRAATESLSIIMAEDLRPYGISTNQLLPGGGTATAMVPDPTLAHLLPPSVMGPPIVFLASPEAEGLTGERLIAKEFDEWLAAFRSGPRPAPLAGDARS
jgi:gluconate 5-dehydrogenase